MEQKTICAPSSEMRKEFEQDGNLARKYLADADAKNLYALYQKRCEQLAEFGSAFLTISELYSGKGEPKQHDVEATLVSAINSIERVALAAIALAAAVSDSEKV